MPSLKEIKGRIGSVKSTLKITSAMKLVASSKLRKAQQAIEGMRPYERKLQEMLAHLTMQAGGSGVGISSASLRDPIRAYAPEIPTPEPEPEASKRVAIVAFASNSSLCGAFNANAVRLALETVQSCGDAQVTVYSVGRKMAEAMKKTGHPSPENYQHLADKPSYAEAAALAEKLMEDFREGRLDRVDLVYNHFVSSAKQVPVRETFLPMVPVIPGGAAGGAKESEADYILEPSASELLDELLPKSLKLKFYTALLDSNASEHAARTVAMQTATDNGEDLLQELTLQYNKSRQSKITAEILDLAGGSQEQ
ncbi:MAG: ATP synthase F1 subunit gamma [Bacteroidales bacterium]|nr:ATP synthase F1 subunit gamma [Bacteroidales bacterium]